MNKFLVKLMLVLYTFPQFYSCRSEKNQSLFIIIDKGKKGFIDSLGKIIIQPEFKWLGNFSEGLALAATDNHHGFIDKTGKVVIPMNLKLFDGPLSLYSLRPNKGSIQAAINEASFSNGLALYADTISQKYGYIDKAGNIAIAPRFWNATKFKDGFAVVMTSYDPTNLENNRLGIIDTKGELIIEDKYYRLTRLSDNFSIGTFVTQKDSQFTFSSVILNKRGNIITTIQPGQMDLFTEFSNGYSYGCNGVLQSLTGAGYFIFDTTGRILKDPSTNEELYFEDVRIDRGRFFWYKVNGKYSWFKMSKGTPQFIDLKVYDTVTASFGRQGLACVKYRGPNANEGYYGYIDTLGNFVLEPKYVEASGFRSGLALASLKTSDIVITGYINTRGEFVWNQEERER
jgi:hypothetical protein